MMATGSRWIDPVAGLIISGVIAWSAFGLLKSVLKCYRARLRHTLSQISAGLKNFSEISPSQ
jgi:Co/Zn/Cd efflux system component